MRAKSWRDDGLKASLADKEKSHVSGVVAIEWVEGMVRWLKSGEAMPKGALPICLCDIYLFEDH